MISVISLFFAIVIYVISIVKVSIIADKKNISINNGFLWIVVLIPILNTIYWLYHSKSSNPFSVEHFRELFKK